MITWSERVHQWSHLPVDDVGYPHASDLLAMSDTELIELVNQMRATRYGGWRNHGGLWREVLGLDSTTDKDILDFGCGIGIEALEFALVGNRVSLADLSSVNVQLAERVLGLFGCSPVSIFHVSDKFPYFAGLSDSFDIFYCNGVLHHIPWARSVMEVAHNVIREDGEARLMTYSDTGWRRATNTDPPEDVTSHPQFEKFVRHFDQVGDYADWYNEAKLKDWFGDLFDVTRCEYITPEKIYLASILVRRSV